MSAYKGPAKELMSSIEEGACYAIRGFGITNNSGQYRLIEHKYKGNIFPWTNIRQERNTEFPRFLFSFKSFDDILRIEDVSNCLPFDVIGRLSCIPIPTKIIKRDGLESDILNLTLEDLQGNILKCTLWDDFIDKFMMLYKDKKDEENIVIVKFCKAVMYHDTIKVQSRTNMTSFLLNDDNPEVNEFREKMAATQIGRTPFPNGFNSPSVKNVHEKITADSISTIMDICDATEETNLWAYGKVVYIDESVGWNYIACKKCSRKVEKVEQRFFCKKCCNFSDSAVMKYKLILHVADDSSMSPFIVWDRECRQVIGKTASEIENLSGEETSFPSIITDAFLGEQFLFNIKVSAGDSQRYNKPYIVAGISLDPVATTANIESPTGNDQSLKPPAATGPLENPGYTADGTHPVPQSALGDASTAVYVDSLKRNLLPESSESIEVKKMKHDNKVKME